MPPLGPETRAAEERCTEPSVETVKGQTGDIQVPEGTHRAAPTRN